MRHYLEPDQENAVADWLKTTPAAGVRDTIDFLSRCAMAIHSGFKYKRREEPGVQAPELTLQLRSGTCRDFALLMMIACRTEGIASRFVCGYLHAEASSENGPPADAIHAWTEVFLPGAGWRGIDPTNGTWCNYCHIPLAAGLCPEETTPIEGTYCADYPVPSRMETSLHLQNPACH